MSASVPSLQGQSQPGENRAPSDGTLSLAGSSRAIHKVIALLRALAPLSRPVMLIGPRGSGKTLAARLLHEWSGRDARGYVEAPAGLFAEGLLLSQLLGHVRGAFTGAAAESAGVFEQAHGGTLFLDEIGKASMPLQFALLTLIESRAFRRLGERRPVVFDVRVVLATNRDLAGLVARGAFLQDLIDRVGEFVIEMPSLSQRVDDVPELAERALRRFSDRQGLSPRTIPATDMDRIVGYPWPGNVRELENVMEWYAVFGALPERVRKVRVRDWSCLRAEMRRHNGNVTAVARSFGVSRQTVYRHLHADRSDAERGGSGT